MSILDSMQWHLTAYSHRDPPPDKEFFEAIQGMKINEAPGETGVTADMIKNLPLEALKLIASLICNFWTKQNTNFQSWHTTKLSNLYKGKGDQQDPNKWRGICLKETLAKNCEHYCSQTPSEMTQSNLNHLPVWSQRLPRSSAFNQKQSNALMTPWSWNCCPLCQSCESHWFNSTRGHIQQTKKIWTPPHPHQHHQETLQQLPHQHNCGKRQKNHTIWSWSPRRGQYGPHPLPLHHASSHGITRTNPPNL